MSDDRIMMLPACRGRRGPTRRGEHMRDRQQFRRIGIDEAQRLVRRGDVVVLDVRDAVPFGDAHIEGAQHLSTANLSDIIDQTPRGRPVLIYGHDGNASRQYARIFADFGFSEV
jgi:rhodanese-related sulfurtransferase